MEHHYFKNIKFYFMSKYVCNLRLKMLYSLIWIAVLLLHADINIAWAVQMPTIKGILQSHTGNMVSVGTSTTISTPVITGVLDASVKNKIILRQDIYAPNMLPSVTNTLVVEVLINYTDASNNNYSMLKKLRIELDTRINRQELKQYNINFTGAYSITMQITNIWLNSVSINDLPPWVVLESTIDIERYYDFTSVSASAINNISITPYDLDNDGQPDEIEASWLPPASVPEEYQLEWTYISDYGLLPNAYIPASGLSVDFKHNSTRITTKDNHYKLSLNFDHGYILFRVRAVGKDWSNLSKNIYGNWSLPDIINVGAAGSNGVFWVNTAHENKKNWQYTATYAEEGKKKEVISYFDGSLRDRQSVTKINTDNNIIVGESFYDFQGRKAVTVLPVPVMATVNTGAGITGTVSPLKYYEKFNVNMSGQPFSAYDFDMDGSGSNTCIVTGAEMDTVSGASRYYSNNNPLLTLDQSYLPHARKYPYTQVEYTSDNTGRIRRQSGVGKYFQLYSGHETQFLYGMPNQIQLNRMFGDEAGEASRYRMQVTIDANGQTSITYMNLEGKTVATSLAGAPPMDGNQLRLDSLKYANENQALLTVDFFNKNSFGQSNLNTIPPSNDRVEFFQQLLVPFRSNYHIDYNFTIDTMGISCPSSTVCFHCVYNLDMYITTECGDTLFKVDSILGYFVKTQDSIRFITRCDTGISFNFQKDTDIVLEAGVYSVSKVLRIHPDALNFYLSKYLDKNFNPCIKTYDDFYNDIWNNMDTTGCDSSDCKQCLNELGSMSNFLAQHPDKDSLAWHILYEDCINQCKTKTECDINFEIMLADVSPGGQYGKYDYTTHSASAYPLSVFNESNLLRANNWANNADMIGNWRHPKIRINYQFYDGYFDETGTRVKVYVNLNPITGQYSPPILSSVTPTLDPVMGQEYVYPEHLKNLVDFMQRWNSFFARSLVVYHPEYAYYLSCQEQSIQFSGEKHSSDAFDVYLKDTVKTFQDAVNEGIIKNNYLSTTVSSFNKR